MSLRVKKNSLSSNRQAPHALWAMTCSSCGEAFTAKRRVDARVGEAKTAYYDAQNLLTVKCPSCGAVNMVPQAAIAEAETPPPFPQDRNEMREDILAVFKNLYPTRTGYNGGHLAHLRNPDGMQTDHPLFWEALNEMIEDGTLRWVNEHHLFLKLSETVVRQAGLADAAVQRKR